MKITIACVGKIKERFFSEAVNEYLKRLSRFADVAVAEVADEKAPENLSPAQAEAVKDREGERLLKRIKDGYVIALAIDGKRMTSPALSEFLSKKMTEGASHIVFVIGGSLGLGKAVLERADSRLSFSDMTFPHQLMRVILLEQIYRSFKIAAKEPYHK